MTRVECMEKAIEQARYIGQSQVIYTPSDKTMYYNFMSLRAWNNRNPEEDLRYVTTVVGTDK